MLEHKCPNCTHERIIYSKKCLRCSHEWTGKVEIPKICPRCKSPYWNKERSANRYPDIYALQPGQKILVPWPANNNGQTHPAIRIVKKLNDESERAGHGRPYSCNQFDGKGGYVYRSSVSLS